MNLPYHALRLRYPVAVEAQTAPDLNDETWPSWSIVTYDFPARGELPPVRLTWYDGGANRSASASGKLTQLAGGESLGANGSICVGERGTLISSHDTGAKYRLLPEDRFRDFKPPASTLPRVTGHYAEWMRACLENKPQMPMSRFDLAGPMTETILLGCAAMRAGERIEWDGEAMKATNTAKLNPLLSKEYRAGWEL
jgi:hypothetical protein